MSVTFHNLHNTGLNLTIGVRRHALIMVKLHQGEQDGRGVEGLGVDFTT